MKARAVGQAVMKIPDEDEFHENAENVSDETDEEEIKEELGSEPEEGDDE